MAGLEEIETALRRHVQGSPPKIDLAAAAADPQLTGLTRPLALLRAQAKLEVLEPRFQRSLDAVELIGAAEFALPGQGLPAIGVIATLTATEPPGGPVYAVSLAVTAPVWRFGDSFATLPHTLRQDEQGLGLEFGDSTLTGLEVQNAVFTARGDESEVELSGRLLATGDLVEFAGWVGTAAWPLALEGTATLPEAAGQAPELELAATVPGKTIDLGGVLSLSSPGYGIYAGPEPERPGQSLPPFSELDFLGTVTLGGGSPIRAHLTTPVLASGESWRLLAELEPRPSLLGGLAQLVGVLGHLDVGDMVTPPALGGFETFKLATVEVWAGGSLAAGPAGKPEGVGVTIVSDKVWEPPIPFLKVKQVGTRWVTSFTSIGGEPETLLAGSVFGSFHFTNPSPEEDGVVDLVGLLPSFVVTGQQREGTSIDAVAAFYQLLGRQVPPPDGKHPKIIDLFLYADPGARVFHVAGGLDLKWQVPFFHNLTILELSFEVLASQSAISGAIGGRLQLQNPKEEGEAVPTLALRAEAPQTEAGGWAFSGGLEPGAPLSVRQLFIVANITLPEGFLDSVLIERLDGSIEPAGSAWALAGEISAGWQPELFGTTLQIAAGVAFDLKRLPSTTKPSGWVEGRFSVNRFALKLRQDVGVTQPTYAIRLEWGDVWLLATTSWTKDKEEETPYQVLAVQLGGVTLGDVLEEIVNLAAPTLGFSLEPPWDVLKGIELSRFTLTVDLREDKRKVALTYKVEADLVLLYLDEIGVSYTMGGAGEVDLIVKGRFLDKEFGRNGKPPLTWDVVNDPPPAVPGKGPRLLELRYLGLGQRVRLKELPDTVSKTMKLLRKDMLPKPGQTDPLEHSPLVFDDAGEWLLGIDLRLLETVEVALIFNDPYLYGISVSLDGERAGSLAGLRFEILYKQLAPGLGMFRGELQIPEAFRHIELGEVAVTLGLVVVEVYTNGNFLIDLGFPHERDYQRSFTVEVFPFVGRGGIYFGVLNGMTSRRVPAITDGTFSPVLELGVGLAVGVGKEISIGPLSGGAYVELEAIFQGVLAWYHPTGSDAAADRYHWAKAMVALHGKVWGEVDFAVVKASVTLEAYAQATAVFESYKATLFELRVQVDAEAEIEIFWITISFSFNVDLDLSFKVGSDEPTPWTPASNQSPGPAVLRQPRRLVAHQRTALAAAGEGAWTLSEDPLVFTAPRQIKATMLPTFSLADAAVTWEGPPPGPARAPSSTGEPQWRMAFPLFIDNGISPSARTAAAVAASVGGESSSSLADVVEGLLRWSLTMIPQGVSKTPGMVTAGELERLAEEMATEAMAGEQFSLDKLKAFFQANFRLKIEGTRSAARAPGGTAFPPPPWLVIDAGGYGKSELLNKEPKVGPHYQRGAAAYMAEFSPASGPSGENPDDDPSEYESFAAHAFRDWCLMVAREAVRQAGLALAATTVPMAGNLKLTAAGLPQDQVSYRVRPGDTIAGVAAWLGAGVAELEELNADLAEELAKTPPGGEISLVVGVGACTLALDNAGLSLAADSVTVSKVTLQVRSEETLRHLAERAYGNGAKAQRLLEEVPELAANGRLLRAGALLAVEARSDLGSDGDLVAATGWVRYQADPAVPDAEWYAQAIACAPTNEALLKSLAPGQSIPPGKELKVPPSFGTEPTATYISQVGDTLLRVGATLSLAQTPDKYGNPAWREFRAAVIGKSRPELPATEVALLPGESLEALAERLLWEGGMTELLPHMEAAQVLDPLAVVELPSVSFPTATYGTLAAVAAAAGLTVEALAARPEVVGATGLFAPETQLAVKHLPTRKIADLVTAVRSGEAFAAIATQASRNLLSGVRLPAPAVGDRGVVSATGPLTGLAELAGWQLEAPPPDPESLLEVTVTQSDPAQSWIELPVGEPLINVEGAELQEGYPSQSLTRALQAGPRPIELSGTVPRTYGLDHRIVLQAAVPPAVPPPPATLPAGAPVLWSFPSTLIARARAQTASSIPYEILRSPAAGAGVADHDPVPASTFGTLVGLRVRGVAGREGVYELIGADGADRELLRELALYARGDTATSHTSLYLGIAPVPGAKIPSGLALPASSATATFAVRTDMATETTLPQAPETLVASLGEASRFLQLLWEGSVSESGYHLAYATEEGQPLPAGAFAGDGTATLWLLAIPRGRSEAAPHGRTLLPTDNCALVADGIDSAAHSLYVEAHEAHLHEEEMTSQALVPAGAAGVTLTVLREKAGATEAEARLAGLLSLLVSRIEGTTYKAGKGAPPAPPHRDDGSGLPLWRRQRLARAARLRGEATRSTTPAECWRFDQVVQLSDFGPPSVAPAVSGLPLPERDPYRGFGAATTLPKATFSLGWADVLGNVSAPSSNKPTEVPIGYVDPLLGPGAWPGVTTSFGVTAGGGSVAVNVTVAAQPGVSAVAPSQGAKEAAEAAEKQAERYAEAYFQLAQPSVKGYLVTTLRQNAAGDPEPLPLVEKVEPLWRFTAAGYVYAAAVATLQPPPLAGIATPEALQEKLGVPLPALAAANAGRPFAELAKSGKPLKVAARLAVSAGDSAATLRERAAEQFPGLTPPESATKVLELTANTELLLRPGAVLATALVSVELPADARTVTLKELAGQHQTTPAQLAIDCIEQTILRPGFSFEAGGQVIAVGDVPGNNCFKAVREAFAALAIDVTIAELAGAAAEREGLFADSAHLELTHAVAAEGQKLATLIAAGREKLAELNAEMTDLFPAGTMVSLGSAWHSEPVVPSDEETLEEFAGRHASTATMVLMENPLLELAGGNGPIVPGVAVLPPPPPPQSKVKAPRSAYSIAPGDTLKALAGVLGGSPASLAEDNEKMPGLLVADRPVAVTVGSSTFSTSTEEDDTPATLTARLHEKSAAIDLESVAKAIAEDATILAAGALLVVPPPPLAARPAPGVTPPPVLTQAQLESAYGIDAVAFAQANAMLPGLLPTRIALAVPGGTTETTKDADSFNAVLQRLAAAGITVELRELLAANPSLPMFVAGVRVLLAPKPVTVSASIEARTEPFAEPVFPLSVTLRLQRDQAVVLAPTAGRDSSAERSDTPVPAAMAPPPNEPASTGEPAPPETLEAFVDAFEEALPGLRLGTARVEGETADLWVVDFTAGGIEKVEVKPTVSHHPDESEKPRYLALRPLYRSLQSLDLELAEVNPSTGQLKDPSPASCQGIDVEDWARRFLADLDLFVSAPYAAAIHAHGPAGALEGLLAARWKLCGAIAGGLAPVLAIEGPGVAAAAAAAARDLARLAGSGLAAAYEVSTILQFDATVDSAYAKAGTALKPARLVGGAVRTAQATVEPGEYSLTRAATALDKTSSYVNFAMTVPDPAHRKEVATNALEYAYDGLEFDIDASAALEGYVPSNRVTLVRPLVGPDRVPGVLGDLGSPVVPVPLRAHPRVPLIVGQTAEATHRAEAQPTLAEAAQWTYGLTYSHEHAEQDEVLLAVTFNIARAVGAEGDDDSDLAASLARYALQADRLRDLMSWYVDPPDPAPAELPTVREHIAATVAELTTEIASAWEEHWPPPDPADVAPAGPQEDVPNGETYHLRTEVAYSAGGDRLKTLTLRLDGTTTEPGPGNVWPAVWVQGADGEFVQLEAGSPSGSVVYSPPSGVTVEVEGRPVVRLEWPGLNVAAVGNAQAKLSARRNQELLPGLQTNADFVLSSAGVTAPDVATPLLEWSGEFPISGSSLTDALKGALTELFEGSTKPWLTVSLAYAHQLVEPLPGKSDSGLVSVLPCALYPHQSLSNDVAEAVAEEARRWQIRHRPAEAGGKWLVSLTLSSWLEGKDSRPLLTLETLSHPLATAE